jgi:hypothetical protein
MNTGILFASCHNVGMASHRFWMIPLFEWRNNVCMSSHCFWMNTFFVCSHSGCMTSQCFHNIKLLWMNTLFDWLRMFAWHYIVLPAFQNESTMITYDIIFRIIPCFFATWCLHHIVSNAFTFFWRYTIIWMPSHCFWMNTIIWMPSHCFWMNIFIWMPSHCFWISLFEWL